MSEEDFLKRMKRLYERYPDVRIRKNEKELKPEEALIVGESYDLDVQIVEKPVDRIDFGDLDLVEDEIETLRRKKRANKVFLIALVSWPLLSILFSYLAVNFTYSVLALGPVNIPLVPFVLFILISFFCGTITHISDAIENDANLNDIDGIIAFIFVIGLLFFGGLCFGPLAIAWFILNHFQMDTSLYMYFGMILPVSLSLLLSWVSIDENKEYDFLIKNFREKAQKALQTELPTFKMSGFKEKSGVKKFLSQSIDQVSDFVFSEDLDLRVVVRAKDIEVAPGILDLRVLRSGSSEVITFNLSPKVDDGEKTILVSFFYENNFYGEISHSVKTEAKK